MSATASAAGGKKTENLVQVSVLTDPAETINTMRSSVRDWDGYWGQAQQAAEADGGEASPAAQEALAIRRMLRGLLAPKLDGLAAAKSPHLGLLLNLMVPFDTRGGLRDFMLHFFQVGEDSQNNLVYEERDPFERDVYVLYDLYRVKKTLEVLDTLEMARKDEQRKFPSIFPEQRIGELLSGMREVLGLIFNQCLPENHRRDLLPILSPRFLKSHSLLERRETNLLYTFPHVLQKYDYRKFFFLVYFKEGLKAKLANENKEFRYNLLFFQVLKHEFLVHWLTGPLKNDPRKYKIYQRYMVQGKSLLEWISEEPAKEDQLLKGMASHTLNDMASQVNEALPEEMKIGVVPESQDFGFYRHLKENLVQAVSMVRAPIDTLRKIAEEQGPDDDEPGVPPPPPPAPKPEPKAAPPPPPPPEPKWEVTLLKKNQVPRPFFMESVATYSTQLSALRVKLGGDWQGFSSYVSKQLENTAEIATVRRRTPKHEWTLPYRLRYVTPDGTEEYLLVLGAEVKAKARGMGYQAKEAYTFTPYFVFATDIEGEGFGEAVGERPVAGHQLKEYSFAMGAVTKRALELLEIIKNKG